MRRSCHSPPFQSFADSGIPDMLLPRLGALGFEAPTEIQRLAIPVIQSGCHALVGAETGTGKTLSVFLDLYLK